MVRAYIGVGANLGSAAHTVRQAIADINTLPLSGVTKTSSLYATAPLETLPGYAAGDDYINAVVEIETGLCAPVLFKHLQQLEQAAGRERPYLNAPRTLDLDLLLYGAGCIESEYLTVPHPRMMQRAFVLVPLAEIAPELVNAEVLRAVDGQSIARVATV
jgi:2-amino-4-hydroxy-6-hydroxymethyldihydropteridine diphosphokinase